MLFFACFPFLWGERNRKSGFFRFAVQMVDKACRIRGFSLEAGTSNRPEDQGGIRLENRLFPGRRDRCDCGGFKGFLLLRHEERLFRFFSSGCRIRNERILLSTESWLPSAEAKWIEVKGNLPFVVSRDSSVSENVVLKLVEDFSAPLVLKGAALDGGDVNVMLKVDSLRPNPLRKGTLSVTISMSSEAPVGFLDFEVQRTDGTAILGKCGGEKDRNSARKHGWRQFLVLDGTHDEEVIVAVKYLVRLKEAVVPVHGRSGLFGTVAKEKVQPGRN